MGRNLSPVLRREFTNLDKDADSRKSAMNALKSYVKDLDSKTIPLFLAQVSETEDPGSSAGEYTISLYEVLARVHGPNIVPQIDNIMSTIIKTLTSSAGSFPLQLACSEVVHAIARYAIDPSTPENRKKMIIQSLCKPLSDSLLGSQESLASGAALCLKVLVDSDNWRFAPDELVNEVCLRVAGALEEKPSQSNSHMSLAMALGKHNSLVVEAYARSLIRSGLRILNAGAVEDNSRKRLSAIQMVILLMTCVDPWSISSELGTIMEEMEKYNTDPMPIVKGAAFEALQTAKLIASEKGSKFNKDPGSVTGSNFGRRGDYNRWKNSRDSGDRSPVSAASPGSQTVYSSLEYDSFAESPMSSGKSSSNFDSRGRSVSRKLWRNEYGGVDVSLKDAFYSNSFGSNGSRTNSECFEDGKTSEDGGVNSEIFSGFVHATPRNGVMLSATPNPQRRYGQCNVDDIRIYTTPRKLICSLHDPVDANSDYSSAKPFRSVRSPASSKSKWSTAGKLDTNSMNDEPVNENSETGEEAPDGFESVSSTCDVAADADTEVCHEVSPERRTRTQSSSKKRESFAKVILKLLCSVLFFILCAILLSTMSTNNQEISLVPT